MKLIGGYPAFDDSSPIPRNCGRGYISRDYKSRPLGALMFAKSAPSVKRLTKAEIKDAIADKTARKAWSTDRCDRVGSGVKNQGASNYCWAHAPVRGCEVAYIYGGGLHVPLSAFDVGASIKNGWNQGGSGIEAIEWIATNGVCTEALHQPLDFSAHRTAEQAANAALHKIDAFDDLDPDDLDLIASYVIADIPVAVGVPAWRHEVLITYLAWEGSDWYPGIDNSWGPDNYGVNGRGVLHGAYFNFDEAGAIRSMTPAAA